MHSFLTSIEKVENISFRKGRNPLKKMLQRVRFTGESPNTNFKTVRYGRVVFRNKEYSVLMSKMTLEFLRD